MKIKKNANQDIIGGIRAFALILGNTIICSVLTYIFLNNSRELIIKSLQDGLLTDLMKFLAPCYLVIFGVNNLIYEIVFSINKESFKKKGEYNDD